MTTPRTYAEFPRDADPVRDHKYRFYRVIKTLERAAGGPIERGASWLDLGCHSGSFLRCLIAHYDVDGVGADAFPESHKIEKRYPAFQATENPWAYRQIELDKPFDLGRQFACVSALEVIEHMIDTDQFLDQCNRHLVTGGYLVLSTPNINMLRNRVRVLMGRYPLGLEHRNVIHHVRLYNPAVLRRHLREHGFEPLVTAGVKMLPSRHAEQNAALRSLSEALADWFPQLATNFIGVARKVRDPIPPKESA